MATDGYAEHARNILRKQSKTTVPKPKPTVAGSSSVAAPTVSAKQFYHPEVYRHVSMHIAERLKKLGA